MKKLKNDEMTEIEYQNGLVLILKANKRSLRQEHIFSIIGHILTSEKFKIE